MQPFCSPCRKTMRIYKNDVPVLLRDAIHNPYQILRGDEYTCPTCGTSVVTGFGAPLFADDPAFEDVFTAMQKEGVLLEERA